MVATGGCHVGDLAGEAAKGVVSTFSLSICSSEKLKFMRNFSWRREEGTLDNLGSSMVSSDPTSRTRVTASHSDTVSPALQTPSNIVSFPSLELESAIQTTNDSPEDLTPSIVSNSTILPSTSALQNALA